MKKINLDYTTRIGITRIENFLATGTWAGDARAAEWLLDRIPLDRWSWTTTPTLYDEGGSLLDGDTTTGSGSWHLETRFEDMTEAEAQAELEELGAILEVDNREFALRVEHLEEGQYLMWGSLRIGLGTYPWETIACIEQVCREYDNDWFSDDFSTIVDEINDRVSGTPGAEPFQFHPSIWQES